MSARRLTVVGCQLSLLLLAVVCHADKHVLRFATSAPDGTEYSAGYPGDLSGGTGIDLQYPWIHAESSSRGRR